MTWLDGGRKGEIADGGMIVKEMFYPPAALYYEPTFGEPLLKDPEDPRLDARPPDVRLDRDGQGQLGRQGGLVLFRRHQPQDRQGGDDGR